MFKTAMHSGLVLQPRNNPHGGTLEYGSTFSSSTTKSDRPNVSFKFNISSMKLSYSEKISLGNYFTYKGGISCQIGCSRNGNKLCHTEKSLHFGTRDSLFGGSLLSVSKKREKVDIIKRGHNFRAASLIVGQAEEDSFLDKYEKVGVLLLNLGGPETLDDVQPFLYNLFADPDIIRLPRLFRFLQRPLAKFISTLRAPKSAEGYAAIGGGSPLRKITDEQADALKKALELKNLPAKVYVGMRYWHPFIEEALEQIKKDGITRLVILPLYPQFSISTSGSSLRLLESIFREDEYLSRMEHTVIPSWYHRGGYVQSMATLIEKELSKFHKPEEVHIFFSAHGVPVSYVKEAGDPYKAEMEECVDLIMNELKSRGVKCKHTLAYQSRVGPVEWLKPYTDAKIKELGIQGIKSLLAVPVSFVSEHIETLEEIDMEYRELAIGSGIVNWGRVPALNCEPTFIEDLADAVLEALPHAGAMSVPNLDPRPNGVDYCDRILGHQLMGYGNVKEMNNRFLEKLLADNLIAVVPLGSVEELLVTYDVMRRKLPAPVAVWEWGWTKSAETWNGRIAMLAVLGLLLLEVTSGEGILHQLGMFHY